MEKKYITLQEAEDQAKICLDHAYAESSTKILKIGALRHANVWANIVKRIKAGEHLEK